MSYNKEIGLLAPHFVNSGDRVTTVTDNKTLTYQDDGKVFYIATDAKTFTLPATAAGVKYTFVNSGADGNNIVTISPNASDGIFGNVGKYELAGTDDLDVVNTKVSAKKGDTIILRGDGVDGWFVEYVSGNWVSSGDVYPYELVTDDVTVDARLNGKVYSIATASKTFTLPAVSTANAGYEFTFINSGAATNNIVAIAPNASDAIHGNGSSSVGKNADATTADGLVDISGGADDKEWRNTAATSNTGDRCTLMSDGVTGWWIREMVGIWVSEG